MTGKEKLAVKAPKKTKSTAKKKPRYIELADELRSAIMQGDYADPGNFPTESVLCEKYDVSRFTVREALRKLTSEGLDRKSTRLNSSHVRISYAVFCLKKKNIKNTGRCAQHFAAGIAILHYYVFPVV